MPEPTLEQRVTELERLLGAILAKARRHPVGRKILAYLDLP